MSKSNLQPNTLVEFRIALIRRGLSQTQLAKLLGISARYVRYMIAGNVPAYRTWQRLHEEFGFAEAEPLKLNSDRSLVSRSIKSSRKVSKVSHA